MPFLPPLQNARKTKRETFSPQQKSVAAGGRLWVGKEGTSPLFSAVEGRRSGDKNSNICGGEKGSKMCECKMAAFFAARNCGGQLCEHFEHGWRRGITAAFNTGAFLSSLAIGAKLLLSCVSGKLFSWADLYSIISSPRLRTSSNFSCSAIKLTREIKTKFVAVLLLQ